MEVQLGDLLQGFCQDQETTRNIIMPIARKQERLWDYLFLPIVASLIHSPHNNS
jgi:hypothetical protein